MIRKIKTLFKAIFLIKNFNAYLTDYLKLTDKDILIDIGAHIGVFSVFAAHYAKNGKVYSFEPSNENFSLLKKNLEINKLNNLEIFNKAVSNKSGNKIFYISESKNKGSNSLYPIKNSNKISVPAVSFANFIKSKKLKKINFLKMDCEGGEYKILFNCPKNVLRSIEKISMEYHNLNEKFNGKTMKSFLESNGFLIKIIPDPNKGIIYAKRANKII